MLNNYGRKIIPMLAFTSAISFACLFAGSAEAVPGKAGWQGRFVFNVPTGQVDQFFHYPCPAAFPVSRSGGFLPNLTAKIGMVVLGNGPRLDLTPVSYNEWSWIFGWPAGAKPGSTISFDVYCTKGPA
jgi:hypothetical protein